MLLEEVVLLAVVEVVVVVVVVVDLETVVIVECVLLAAELLATLAPAKLALLPGLRISPIWCTMRSIATARNIYKIKEKQTKKKNKQQQNQK